MEEFVPSDAETIEEWCDRHDYIEPFQLGNQWWAYRKINGLIPEPIDYN
jgi:hypothetical protein